MTDVAYIHEITNMFFSYTVGFALDDTVNVYSEYSQGYVLFIISSGYAHNKHYDDLGINIHLVTYMYYTLSLISFMLQHWQCWKSRKAIAQTSNV